MARQMMPIYEPLFSDGSYGYRPGRSAKDAILVNLLRREIRDERVIQMVKRYLRSGVMENGVVIETEEGPPQGGNLSPSYSIVEEMTGNPEDTLTEHWLRYWRRMI